jgi:hypothetical protein
LGEKINEYTTKHLSTLAFPELFPYGKNCIFDPIFGVNDKE